MSDGFPVATSARARRTRSAASGAASKPAQSSMDDFLGGGGPIASAPPSEPAKGMPEAGGWVSDKSGVEKYEGRPVERQPVPELTQDEIESRTRHMSREQKPMNRPFESFPLNGLLCEVCKEPQRITPSGATCRNEGHGGAFGIDPKEAKWQPPEEKPLGMKPNAAPMRPNEIDAAIASSNGDKPDLHPAYGRIVRTMFAFDPDKIFDELNEKRRFGKPIKDMGYLELAESLDDAARMHRNASLLFADSQVKRAQFEADCEAIAGDMRTQASNALKREKDEKGGKQITNGDVEARMASMFPDEYRRQNVLKAKIKATVGQLEDDVKWWELRRREIDTMLRECRKA